MKRIGYLHDKVYDIENIEKADDKARKNKSIRWGIVKHDRNRQEENERLSEQLRDLVYETSEYSTFKVYEPKERLIFRLPYYPDRITHHATMNVMEPIWTKIFIKQTYSCIKNRGIHNVAGLRFSNWDGKKSNISRFYNKYIHIVDIVSYSKCFRVNFVYNNKSYYFESKSRNLFYSLTRYSFPVNFKIRPYVRTKKNRNGCAARLNREIR